MKNLKIHRGNYMAANGQAIRVYAIDGAGYFCIHGAFKGASGWFSGRWSKDGEYAASIYFGIKEPELNIIAKRTFMGIFGYKSIKAIL